MKLTDKAKKRLILTGLGAVCIVLVIAIASQFKAEKPKDFFIQPSSKVSDSVSPGTATPTGTTEASTQPVSPAVTPDQSADTGDSTGTEQSIQAEVTKPTEPPQEVKTDPSKTPDGEKVTAVKSAEHDKAAKPESSTSSSKPKAGDKKDGKIYVPGFGWIEDNGGGGSGTTAGDMYENGNKIGDMN